MVKGIWNVLLCMFLLSFCTCKTIWINTSKDNDSSGANSVSQLEIMPTDVTGWQQVAPPWSIISASNLHTVMDGGDILYIQNHVIEAGIQYLQGPNSKQIQTYCMDFGNQINSHQMFLDQKQTAPVILNIPNYPDTVAIAASALGGVTVYAYFSKFYLELSLTGFQDQAEALQTASLFLDIYTSKIE